MFIALAKGAIPAGGGSLAVYVGGGHSRFIQVYRCTEMGNVADSQQGFIRARTSKLVHEGEN